MLAREHRGRTVSCPTPHCPTPCASLAATHAPPRPTHAAPTTAPRVHSHCAMTPCPRATALPSGPPRALEGVTRAHVRAARHELLVPAARRPPARRVRETRAAEAQPVRKARCRAPRAVVALQSSPDAHAAASPSRTKPARASTTPRAVRGGAAGQRASPPPPTASCRGCAPSPRVQARAQGGVAAARRKIIFSRSAASPRRESTPTPEEDSHPPNASLRGARCGGGRAAAQPRLEGRARGAATCAAQLLTAACDTVLVRVSLAKAHPRGRAGAGCCWAAAAATRDELLRGHRDAARGPR